MREATRLVRRMLRESGRSQSWLSRHIGVVPSSVNHWMTGRNAMPFETLRKIGKVLGYRVCITVAPTASGRQGLGGGK